jgi:hypothetical protein
MALGIVLFAVSDGAYYYLLFNDHYIPNSLIDFLYSFSLSIIAYGAYLRIILKEPFFKDVTFKNIGRKNSWFYLMLFPFANLVLEVTAWLMLIPM